MANSSVLNTSRQILPVLSLLAGLLGSTVTAAGEGPGLQTIPPGYHLVASEIGVPAEALYSVSLAETSRKLPHGERPWPWTLNVAGKGYRYNTRQEAYDALLSFMRSASMWVLPRSISAGTVPISAVTTRPWSPTPICAWQPVFLNPAMTAIRGAGCRQADVITILPVESLPEPIRPS